jgi:hypothetical protein
MDYPKRIPNVGLVGGKFVDENVSTGLPGSLIPSAWGNAVTDELLAVIKAAGLVPSEDNNAQLLQAIQGLSASDVKRAVRVATTGPIALSGLQTIDGVALAAGDRVLVKDQANAAQNWIYTASANAWSRALDANEDAECTPGHLIIVQAGTAYAGTMWQLANTLPPQVGTTPLAFVMLFGKTGVAAGSYRQVAVDTLGRVTAGSNPTTAAGYGLTDVYTTTEVEQRLAARAPLDSPKFTGTPEVPTAAAGADNQQAANTAFVRAAISSLVDSAPGSLDTLKELAAALGNDPNFATTVLNALAAKADNAAVTAELGRRLLVGAVSQQRPSLSSPTNTADWNSAALEIREAKQVSEWAPTETGDQWAPGIAFHWAGKVAGKLFMDSLGKLKWNGNELLTKQAGAGFLSGYIQITAGAPVVVSHNLGYVPSLDSVEVFWECVTAQGGWQPGESFKVLTWMQDNTSVASTTGAYAYDVNASTVTIGFGSSASVWALPAKGTGGAVTMNLANWRARIRIKA